MYGRRVGFLVEVLTTEVKHSPIVGNLFVESTPSGGEVRAKCRVVLKHKIGSYAFVKALL
jgi:hypothetical protein